MKIHTKALIIFAIAVIVLFSVVILLSMEISLGEFRRIERERVTQRGERFEIDLEERLRPVSVVAADWASRDEVRRAVEEHDSNFAESTLNNQRMGTLDLNFLFLADTDGALISGVFAPDGATETTPLSSEDVENLRSAGYLPLTAAGQGTRGSLLIDGRVCFVAAYPVASGDDVAGSIVAGAFLRPADVRGLEVFSGYRMAFLPLAAARTNPDWSGVIDELLTSPRPVVRVLGSNEIAVFSLQRDFRGHPVFVSRLSSPRLLYSAGKRTIRLFLTTLALSGGVLFFLVWFGLDRSVLTPIRSLQNRVAQAASSGDLPADLAMKGDDEVAMLSREIDGLAKSVAAAKANYHDVVEAQTDLICRFVPSGAITFVNQAFCDFTGHSRDQLIGQRLHDVLPSFDQAALDKRIRGLTPAESLARCEDRYLGPGRTVFWLQRVMRGSFDSQGELVEVQSVISDITENRRAQVQLEESEARYRNLFEHASDGILIVDPEDGVIWDVNPSLCEMLGYEADHFLGQEFRKTPPLAYLSLEIDRRKKPRDLDVRRVRATPLRTGSGGTVYVDIVTASYVAGGRRLLQWNVRDVTARRRADDELQRLSGRLLTLQDQERRRIARELHDSTGQNLTALQMNLSMLQESIDTDDEQLLGLLTEARSLCDLSCAEIRTISYLLHPPLLDEVGILFAVKWLVDGFSKRTGVLVSLEFDEGIPRLPSELETSLYRIVQESLNNIHRHSEGTCAWIRFKKESEAIVVEVEDNGSGINPELLDPANLASPSLGVGLLGMRERLSQLNGRLIIESASTGTMVRAIVTVDWENVWQNSEFS